MYRLIKPLYRPKQKPKHWNEKFDKIILLNDFKINECNKCVYIKFTPSTYVIIYLYIDDMLVNGRFRPRPARAVAVAGLLERPP